jgi:hypothetical protein
VSIVGVNVPIIKCVSIYLAFIKVEKPDRFRRRQITIGRFQSAVFKVKTLSISRARAENAGWLGF